MHERQRGISSAAEAAGEADPHGRPEELLDPHVERPEDAIELVVGDRLVGDLAGQEDSVLPPDGEGRSVELEVAPQQVLVERSCVLLRGGHHVGLVVEGALAEVEPDGEDVLLLTAHAHEPAALAGLGVRSEEHTSELQSLMRISYAVFCLKKKKNK